MTSHANDSKHAQLDAINIIDGVGVDLTRFYPRSFEEKRNLRNELGFGPNEFIITNVAELNKNKNQIMLIKALPKIKKIIPCIKVLLIGKDNYSIVKSLANRLELNSYIEFLGYRGDVDKLIAISDLAFSASIREGLPINIVEAMASGVPVVCSRNRGHNSLIKHGISGLIFSINNQGEMIKQIIYIYKNPNIAEQLAAKALEDAKLYSIDIALDKMAAIYRRFMPGGELYN